MADVTAPKKNWISRAISLVILLPAVLFALYLYAALHYAYATGERAGYLQKISRKGWVCKTWEGELAMANLPGALPQIFAFTVAEERVARKIEELAGERVALTYEQKKGLPTRCFGETEYFVVAVRKIAQP